MIPTQYSAKAVSTTQDVFTRKPVAWGTSTGTGTGFYTEKTTGISYSVYAPSRADLIVPRTRPIVATMPHDVNGSVIDDGIPTKFTSPEFFTHTGGYEGVSTVSIPSREQFVSEGGLFGEGAGEVIGAEEGGFFGEVAKGFGDWTTIALLIGGLFLLFLIGAIM